MHDAGGVGDRDRDRDRDRGEFGGESLSQQLASMSMSMNQSAFFSDNLAAFEIWLDFGGGKWSQETPMHLPILLQVLLSQTHRLHALLLLRRYLSLGPESVNLALLVGIFPYILKLLQSPAQEIRRVLVCIWAAIIGFDPSCRVELIRDKSQVSRRQYHYYCYYCSSSWYYYYPHIPTYPHTHIPTYPHTHYRTS